MAGGRPGLRLDSDFFPFAVGRGGSKYITRRSLLACHSARTVLACSSSGSCTSDKPSAFRSRHAAITGAHTDTGTPAASVDSGCVMSPG